LGSAQDRAVAVEAGLNSEFKGVASVHVGEVLAKLKEVSKKAPHGACRCIEGFIKVIAKVIPG